MVTLAMLLVAVALFGTAWQLGYSHTVFVPSPAAVWAKIKELLGEPDTYVAIRQSLVRLVIGMAIGTTAGFVGGILSAYSVRTAGVVRTYVHITFSIPSLMAAFIALVVLGITGVGVIATVAVLVFPFVTLPVLDGVKSLDRSLNEMARVYRASLPQQLRHVVVPHIAPYLLSGIRNAHSLGWKVLIVAEIFSVRSGIGYEFHEAYDQFDFASVLSWLLFMLVVIGLIEFAVLRPVEGWTLRWHSGASRRAPRLGRALSRLVRPRKELAV